MSRHRIILGIAFLLAGLTSFTNSAKACWRCGHHVCRWCERHQQRQMASNSQSYQSDPGAQQFLPLDLAAILKIARLGVNAVETVKPGTIDPDRLNRIEELLEKGIRKSEEGDSDQTKTFTEFGNDLEKRLKAIEEDIQSNREAIDSLSSDVSSEVSDVVKATLEDKEFIARLAKALGRAPSASPSTTHRVSASNAEVYRNATGADEIDGLATGVEVTVVGDAENGRIPIHYSKDGRTQTGYVKVGDVESVGGGKP